MATVAELKDEAVKLGLTGISKLKKADLETLISAARDEAQRTADARQAESATEATAEAVPSDPRAVRRALADAAGKRATVTSPMDNQERVGHYAAQRGMSGALEWAMSDARKRGAQARRTRKKFNRMLVASGVLTGKRKNA